MKVKTKTAVKKRYTLSNPKHGKAKIEHTAPGFGKKQSQKRKFRVFRGRMNKMMSESAQSRNIQKALS